MFKERIQKIKNIFVKKTDGNNKKNIENLIVFIILLIITIISVNIIWGDNKDEKSQILDNTASYKQLADKIDNNSISSTTVESDEYNLEENLENILSKISGVGDVKVLITYYQTSEIVPMYNETYSSSLTEETDTEGGTRKISETDTDRQIIYEEKNGSSNPITEKVVMPKVEGAIVIAKGASNVMIKSNIIEAVSAVTGVAQHKIQVFEMNS